MAGSLWLADRAMPRQVVFARETAGDYRFYYLKDGSLHSVTKGTREIWHYRRTGGKAPPLFGASFGAMAKADAEPPAAKTRYEKKKQAEKRKAEADEKKKQARKQRKTEADEKKKQANKSKEEIEGEEGTRRHCQLVQESAGGSNVRHHRPKGPCGKREFDQAAAARAKAEAAAAKAKQGP